MANAFSNKFLSIAGQKERLSNVGKVLGIATGVYNPTKTKIQANTKSKVVNYALETVANHPYAAAGVVASASTIYKNAPAISSIMTKSAGSSIATGTKIGLSSGALIGAGLIGASVLGGTKSTSNPIQDINPKQDPYQDFQTKQDTTTNPNISNTEYNSVNNNIYGDYGSIGGNLTPSTNTDVSSNPTVPISAQQDLNQDTNADQTSTASSGISWITMALIGAGVYLLSKD